jgi:hypothetical protein
MAGDVIVKWKCEDTITTKPRLGRPPLMTDRDCRALKNVVHETCQILISITREFCSATNCPASTMTVCKELRGMGFHGWAAAHKPNISPVNAKHHPKWCKERCHWQCTTGNMWFGVINRAIPCGSPMGGFGCGECLPSCAVPMVKFGGGGITVWGCFSWNGLGPLIILHRNVNVEEYKDILSHCMLSTVEDQFSGDCISMTVLPAIKQGLWGNGLWSIRFQKWSGQPSVLNWIP